MILWLTITILIDSQMSNTKSISDDIIMTKIYYIRDQKVMLDNDLAELYGVGTRRLNEQVTRNIDRFPDDFMFRLNESEFESLMSQFATSKRGGRRKLPYVFTEHGILMLANVLKNEMAILMSIKIIEVFVKIRELIFSNQELLLKMERLEGIITDHDNQIQVIFDLIRKLIKENNEPRDPIGFKFKSKQ